MTPATVQKSTPPVNGSIHKIELDWSDVMAGHFPESPARQAWREVVDAVTAKAKTALPESNGRIDAARKLVLAGEVELLPDGTAKVASQSHGTTSYFVVNGACQCKDFPKAPAQMCKHRLAYGMHKRAKQLVAEKLQDLETPAHPPTRQNAPEATIVPADNAPVIPPPPEPVAPLPEAPASCNTYISLAGYKVQVTLRDRDEHALLSRMQALLAHFPLATDETDAASPAPPPVPEGWCRRHDCQMTRQSNAKGAWWSHCIDGAWCKGK